MKLYTVTYHTWNGSFSGLNYNEMLAVGTDPDDAINRVKARVDKDARDFSAFEIKTVMGCDVYVSDPIE